MSATRRRGDELERAIHDAVFAEVTERGYADATYEGVAARASTSKPVLYRRWPTKAEMVLAAIGAKLEAVRLDIPDTGDLAGDVAAILTVVRRHFHPTLRRTALGLLAELDDTTGDALQALLLTKGGLVLEPVVARARTRGELGTGEIPSHVMSLPVDLARHDLFTSATLTDNRIDAITHQIVIPLLRFHSGVPD